MLGFENLTLGYDRHPTVHHLSGRVEAGEMLAIMGPNGGGKSTLLKAVAGQITPLAGSIQRAAGGIAYMPQLSEFMRDFPISAFDFALSGRTATRGMFSRLSHGDRETAHSALHAVGLSGFEDRPIRTLSGGQVQRLLFARLMVQDARLILLDEPFAAVDQRTTNDLMAILHRWQEEGRTTLAVLHDTPLVRHHFAKTLLLAREVIAWGPTALTLTSANLERARTMAEASDRHASECHRES